MSTLEDVYDQQMRPVMNKIDQVRALLPTKKYNVDFPSVIVVGDQSSGKSSLLESLSSIELPKGDGMVTRCPLVLRLRQSTKRAIYRISGDEKILLDEANLNIRKYIEDETQKLVGDEKTVVEVGNVIELLVENSDVRDLTLIDLPGIARVALKGQPVNIYEQTTDLIRRYIREKSSVILCVCPANVDIGTVESFKLADKVDPQHIRTIGVITKSDLASDPEKLAQQLAMNNPDVLHLKLGFVAVRNRSTDENISLKDARERERDFFRKHPASTTTGVHWNCLGIDALMNRLAILYSDRVKETFPKMIIDIKAGLKQTNEEISKLPPNLETSDARLKKYYELADIFVEKILQVRINGSHDGRHLSMINMLHQQFTAFEENMRKQNRELWTPEYREKVKADMSVYFGEHLPNFPPESRLKYLIHEKLGLLWNNINSLINCCFQKTIEALFLNDDNEIYKNNMLLPKLMPIFKNAVKEYMQEKKQAVHDLLNELLKIEKQNPYTTNTYYSNTINLFKKHIQQEKQAKSTSKAPSVLTNDSEELEIFDAISNDEESVQIIIISVYAYWKLLTKRFIDYAALSLRAHCAFNVRSTVRERLQLIPHEQYDLVERCFADGASFIAKRKALQEKKKILEKVYDICHASDTTDTMSPINDLEMEFDLTLKNHLSTSFNNSIGDSIYCGDIAPEGSNMDIEFRTRPSKMQNDHLNTSFLH